jgi:hypothetical protein
VEAGRADAPRLLTPVAGVVGDATALLDPLDLVGEEFGVVADVSLEAVGGFLDSDFDAEIGAGVGHDGGAVQAVGDGGVDWGRVRRWVGAEEEWVGWAQTMRMLDQKGRIEQSPL